ncbi:MAG: helix-turn-helix domain-containing protein [Verrucomicrobia bacterium]|nr:helix-turn-helix domain-containing protein [Verrucomicrobiota bacterium]
MSVAFVPVEIYCPKPKSMGRPRRTELTSEEHAKLRDALQHLAEHLGGNSKLAEKLGVSPDLVLAWRKGPVTPTVDHSIQLGCLKSEVDRADPFNCCREWLRLAGRAASDELLKERLGFAAFLKQSPSLFHKLEAALRPLLGKPIGDEQYLPLVSNKVSQLAARERLDAWLRRNPGGEVAFFWDVTVESVKILQSHALDKFYLKILSPYVVGSPWENSCTLKAFFCLRKSEGGLTGDLNKAYLMLLDRLRPRIPQLERRFTWLFSDNFTSDAVGRWIYNGRRKEDLRGTLIAESDSGLEEFIRNLQGFDTELAKTDDDVFSWTAPVIELPRLQVERFLESRQIAFSGTFGKLNICAPSAWTAITSTNASKI